MTSTERSTWNSDNTSAVMRTAFGLFALILLALQWMAPYSFSNVYFGGFSNLVSPLFISDTALGILTVVLMATSISAMRTAAWKSKVAHAISVFVGMNLIFFAGLLLVAGAWLVPMGSNLRGDLLPSDDRLVASLCIVLMGFAYMGYIERLVEDMRPFGRHLREPFAREASSSADQSANDNELDADSTVSEETALRAVS